MKDERLPKSIKVEAGTHFTERENCGRPQRSSSSLHTLFSNLQLQQHTLQLQALFLLTYHTTMFTAVVFAASFAPFALGWPIFPLPCSLFSGPSCICPPGTDYSESATIALIGATPGNVGYVTNSCKYAPGRDSSPVKNIN